MMQLVWSKIWVLMVVLALASSACGEDDVNTVDENNTDVATNNTNTTSAENNTATNNPDANNTNGFDLPGICGDSFEFVSTDAGVTSFERSDGSDGYFFSAESIGEDGSPSTLLVSLSGVTGPGTFELSGNYDSCENCLRILTDCDTGLDCSKTLYANTGTIEVSEIGVGEGDAFNITIKGAVFKEVLIDRDTRRSTTVAGGQSWCIGEMVAAETITKPKSVECVIPSVKCIGDTINDFELQSCASGEMVSFNSVLEGKKALWVVATAGWCSACREWIPKVVDYHLAEKEKGLEVMYVVGEDYEYAEPSLEFCADYITHYPGSTLDQFYLDHNGEYGYTKLFSAMWLYTNEDGSFGLPWNAIISGDGEYIYSDNSGAGGFSLSVESLIKGLVQSLLTK